MKLFPKRIQSLLLLFCAVMVLLAKSSLAQGGPSGGGGGALNPYACLSTVNIGGGYKCADNVGSPYPYPAVFQTHTESGNSIVDNHSPMAAKKGETLTATMTLVRASNAPEDYVGTPAITLQYFTPSGLVSLSHTTPNQISVVPGGTGTITFQITLPSYVTKGDLVIYFTGDGWLTGSYEQKLYIVCDAPIECMTIPWVGVLEDSCNWALGKSTTVDVVTSLTIGLFNSGAIFYDQVAILSSGTNPGSLFKLSLFLASSRPIYGQCYDASNYNAICLYTQGRVSTVEKRRGQVENVTIFFTNRGILIGHADFGEEQTWQAHQLVILLNGSIADPTIGLYSRNNVPVTLEPFTYWVPGTNGLIKSIAPGAQIFASNSAVTIL